MEKPGPAAKNGVSALETDFKSVREPDYKSDGERTSRRATDGVSDPAGLGDPMTLAEAIVLTAVDPNGLAAGLGFAVGDVVIRMQDTPIQTVDDMVRVATEARTDKRGFVAVLKANSQGMVWTAVPVSD